MKQKLSDYVMDFIASQGVEYVFMVAGGGAMHLVDSLGKHPKLKYVCALHEQGAAIMAEAYAQYTGKLGVCLVTTGPGGTNALTGLAGAWLESTPVLFISGQVKTADMRSRDRARTEMRQRGFQELNIVDVARPLTKYATTVCNPNFMRYALEGAVWSAQSGRPGPVWLDIPLDVQAAEIDPSATGGFFIPTETVDLRLPGVSACLAALKGARRPLILAGNGIRLAGALDTFKRLLPRLNIPLVTTWKALDFVPEDDPLYCGRPGIVGQRGANFAIQNCDVLLSIGARLDFGQTGYDNAAFASQAQKIIVDVDEAELTKHPAVLHVNADALHFLCELERQLQSDWEPRMEWRAVCKQWQRDYPVVLFEYRAAKWIVNPYVLIDVLADEMLDRDVLVPGSSGQASEVTMQAFRCKAGQRVLNTQGLGSMGFGIPAAIGACLASGGRRTVCVEGDGSFWMNVQELEVIYRLKLPIKIFVLNNYGYGSIKATQDAYFGRRVGCEVKSGLSLPQLAGATQMFGLPLMQLQSHENINRTVRRILDSDGPVICEVHVSDQPTLPKVTSYRKPDGSIASRPFHDMEPLLSREELARNMIGETQ